MHTISLNLERKMRAGFSRSGKDGRDVEIDVGNFFESLPEGFVANALALTTPKDVCRLSLVSTVFRSAANWDTVWEKFLPADYQKILSEAEGGGGSVSSGSKKELYLRLCDHPVIIDGGNKSFSLDKPSAKKCYMLAARDLSIVWGDTPRYWRWISLPESRFLEVAELTSVCWLEVCGTVSTSMLTEDTVYVAYLVYKLTQHAYGFETQPAEVSIGINGIENQTQTKTVFLDPEASQRRTGMPARRMGIFNRVRRLGGVSTVDPPLNGPKTRQDGWMEVEIGEYYNKDGKVGDLQMSMTEVKGGNWKGGLVIQGIEIRPKV